MIKDVVKLFGYEVEDESKFDVNDFKSFVDSKFIAKDAAINDETIVSAVTGKRLGSATTKFAQAFGLKASELNGKKLEDLFAEVSGSYNSTIEELKKKATEGNDKKLNDLQKALEEKDKSITDYKTLAEQTASELDKTKNEAFGQLKAYKLNDKVSKIKSQISFVDGFEKDAVRKTGFDTLVSSKYVVDLGENDEVIVKDTKGHFIPSKLKAGSHADLAEVLSLEAEANGLLKKNNGGGGKKPFEGGFNGNGGNNGGGSDIKIGGKFELHPAAVRNAERK
jgi:hypothetical protein